jgi:hypothetical protein
MILFLDNDPARAALMYGRMKPEDRDSTIWCRTAEEAMITLNDYAGSLTSVYLDSSLIETEYSDIRSENSGMEVVRYLEKAPAKLKIDLKSCTFTVHTWDKAAGVKMFIRLFKAGYNVKYRPFGS